MTYRAGTHGLGKFGIADGEPRVVCDLCGAVQRAQKPSGLPYAWLLDGRAPPRWRLVRDGDRRRDYCPVCRDSPAAA